MKGLGALAAVVAALGSASPSPLGAGEIDGYMFGDYYYVLAADEAASSLPARRNAFQFRRLYFTYERQLGDSFSSRYRLEANDAGFGRDEKMRPFVKHAYLKWKGVLGGDLYLGLSGTPTWSVAEETWGYRSVEKTLLDLNKIGSSADIGLALKGKAGRLAYHLMVGNGPGQKPEDDHGKKFYGQVQFEAAAGLRLVGYADYDMRPQGRNQLTLKAFAGVRQERFGGGIETFVRMAAARGDVAMAGLSAFGSLGLAPRWRSFSRVDVVNRNDEDSTDLLLIVGLDYLPADDVHLMPNLHVQLPDGLDPTIQGRLTTFYKF